MRPSPKTKRTKKRGIPRAKSPSTGHPTIKFSFKHLDFDSREKFSQAKCKADFLRGLLMEIKTLSALAVDDFCDSNHRAHSHYIEFSETSEPDGFPNLDEQMNMGTFLAIWD